MSVAESIFLIGYRGTGKTTVAKLLAAELDAQCVDSDDLVEAMAGNSIAKIFATQGEPVFRDLEQQAVKSIAEGPPRVVSLGGGAVLCEETRRRLQGKKVVWLRASPQVLAERLAADTTTTARRPSLTSEGALAEIEQVLAVRTPIYEECATFILDTQGLTPEAVGEQVLDWLRTG